MSVGWVDHGSAAFKEISHYNFSSQLQVKGVFVAAFVFKKEKWFFKIGREKQNVRAAKKTNFSKNKMEGNVGPNNVWPNKNPPFRAPRDRSASLSSFSEDKPKMVRVCSQFILKERETKTKSRRDRNL
jgi:hypothetical protein